MKISFMANCKKCGKSIEPQYQICHSCHIKSTYIDENGYRRFKDDDIPVHRQVAKKKLGRPLRPGEVVHHRNRKKTDNRPSNLWIFPDQEEHENVHREDGDIDDEYDDDDF
jgi:hypothetical protein